LKDHFDPYLDDMSSKYNKDITQILMIILFRLYLICV